MQEQFLNPPIQELRYIQFVLRGARQFVDPAKFFRLASGSPEHPEHLTVERQLINASGESI
jgi:hypothetical protein